MAICLLSLLIYRFPAPSFSSSSYSLCNLHVKETYVCLVVFATPGFSLCLVAQSCPAVCDPMDFSLPGSSVHGILQARILEWVAMPTSRGSSQPRDHTQVSCIAGGFFTIWDTREAPRFCLAVRYHLIHSSVPYISHKLGIICRDLNKFKFNSLAETASWIVSNSNGRHILQC